MSGADGGKEPLAGDIRKFVEERNWERFHSPKNLSMALAGEAAEILEIFQWMTQEQSRNLDEEKLGLLADEIADVYIYLFMLADKTGVDIAQAAKAKLQKNREKYPAGKWRDERDAPSTSGGPSL